MDRFWGCKSCPQAPDYLDGLGWTIFDDVHYRGRISGPLMDRIDMQLEVPAVPQLELVKAAAGEPTATVRARVEKAAERQRQRQGRLNALLDVAEIDRHCAPDAAGAQLLAQAIQKMGLSARAYHRILKLARTIADLAGSEALRSPHVAEAIQYRRMDRA